MKKILKFFTLKIILVGFCLFVAAQINAQDLEKECESIYQSLRGDKNLYQKEKLEKILETAKKYLKKCNDIKGKEELRAYLEKQIPALEQRIKEVEKEKTIVVFNLEIVCENTYQEFLDNRKGPELKKFQKAIDAGKKYLERCGDLKDQEAVKDYVNKQLSKLGEFVNPSPHPHPPSLIGKFNLSVPAKNWDVTFATGKEIIVDSGGDLDVSLVLASIGFDNASANPPNDKYNDEAITYAKMALQLMKENKPSGTERYGEFAYVYKTKECPDGKLNATGWMNYTIGYIMFVRQKQRNAAIPYLYQATQIGCETKNIAEIYRLIGDWYFEEFKKTENSALRRGYASRALDAYARAYDVTPQNSKELKIAALNRVKTIYEIYYSNSKGLNDYLKSVTETTFIDPSTPVSPLPKNEQ